MYPKDMEPFAVAALLTGLALLVAFAALFIVLTLRVRTARHAYSRTNADQRDLYAEFDTRA